jgi:hypothetical protein
MASTAHGSLLLGLVPCGLLVVLACGARTGELPSVDPGAGGSGGDLGVSKQPSVSLGGRGGAHATGGTQNNVGGSSSGGSSSGGSSSGGSSSGGSAGSAGAGGAGGRATGGGAGASVSGSSSGGAGSAGVGAGGLAAGGSASAGSGGTGGAVQLAGAGGVAQGGSGGATNDCCTAHGTASCSLPAVGDCVCGGHGKFGGDPFCCSGNWDDQCAHEVTQFGCGSCPLIP